MTRENLNHAITAERLAECRAENDRLRDAWQRREPSGTGC